MLNYYEIKNRITGEAGETFARTFSQACRSLGWKPQECKCIWKSEPDYAGDPENY